MRAGTTSSPSRWSFTVGQLFICLSLAGIGPASSGIIASEAVSEPSGQNPTEVWAQDAIGLQVVWRSPLGSGNSRIVVSEGRALTLFSDGESDWLIALDVTSGEEIWRYRIAPTYLGHDASHDGPHASPVADEGVVYSLGPRGHLFAVNLADGREVWARDIVAELGAVAPFWGFASTPVVAGRVLVVQTGGSEGKAISGFDKVTGEMLWSTVDDRIGYQSPEVMNLAGRRQVVAVTNQRILGMEPETGEILWSFQHSTENLDGSSEPASIDENRFLVTSSSTEYRSAGALYQVTQGDTGFEVEQLWTSKALSWSYAVPAFHDGRLYGFQRGILTCVDQESGQAIWKSRLPGGNNLQLARDRLVIVANDGVVAVAEASPEGYRELARARALERSGLAAPAVADDTIFVRNHEEIAAIRIAGIPQPRAAELGAVLSPPIDEDGDFGDFVRGVSKAPEEERRRRVDEFLAEQKQLPIVVGDDRVHFVYRGPATDVAVHGNHLPWGSPQPMQRIPGTDFFYRSLTLQPASRWQYVFEVDFEKWIADPLNPRRAPDPWWGEVSELTMPGWLPPEHLREPVGPRGAMESFDLESEILGNSREVKVYLPTGYAESAERYPLLIVADGLQVLEHAQTDRSLDNLIGGSVAPLIVAFVGSPEVPYQTLQEAGGPQRYREFGGSLTAGHARMLAEELVPHLDQSYRTLRRQDARAVMGIGSAGLAALYAAVHHPEVFGKVAVQSMKFGPTPMQSSRLQRRPIYEAVLAAVEGEQTLPLLFYVDWASHDLRSRGGEIDLVRDNRELVTRLRHQGHSVTGGEYPGGDGWGSWRARTDEILEALFPMVSDTHR